MFIETVLGTAKELLAYCRGMFSMIFLESFISQTVIGMVKSLRGVGDIETVDLKLANKLK